MPLTITHWRHHSIDCFKNLLEMKILVKLGSFFQNNEAVIAKFFKTFVFSFNTKENCFLDELYVTETAL
jgi:tRNA/tmRNA/rRNA uracil-C5-methylase (TrmA/RlmC/RlmD family)